MSRPPVARRLRPSALTTPAVTVQAKPSGLPIAIASWPTRIPRAEAKLRAAGLRGKHHRHTVVIDLGGGEARGASNRKQGGAGE